MFEKLLDELFRKVVKKGVTLYYPKKSNAHEFWWKTGVCPECNLRSISMGQCLHCGKAPK